MILQTEYPIDVIPFYEEMASFFPIGDKTTGRRSVGGQRGPRKGRINLNAVFWLAEAAKVAA